MAEKMKIIPLGGLDEVGKNMTVYEFGGEIIIVDCGMGFPGDDMYGIDLVIPDVSYLVKQRSRIRGMFITHGHEDHIGSIPYILKQLSIPIYCTRLTAGLIKLNIVACLEGLVEEDKHAACEVGQAVLHCKTDGDTGGAQCSDNGSDIESKSSDCHDNNDYLDAHANAGNHKAGNRLVNLGASERTAHSTCDKSCSPEAHNKNYYRFKQRHARVSKPQENVIRMLVPYRDKPVTYLI